MIAFKPPLKLFNGTYKPFLGQINMISQVVKEKLKHRFISLLWRAGGMFAIMVLEYITTNIGLLDLYPLATILIGLCVGEITKFLNVNLKEIRAKGVDN